MVSRREKMVKVLSNLELKWGLSVIFDDLKEMIGDFGDSGKIVGDFEKLKGQ